MAISKTRSLIKMDVFPASGEGDPAIRVTYTYSFDDSEDSTLPVDLRKDLFFEKRNSEGELTDMSGEDALVQTVAAAIWS